eukprot:SAG31_NODE_51_length_30464_cov_16.835628_3_plen_80_part_00
MVGMVGSPRVAAHRARRGAARRHLSEFRSKDYCSAGEKSPTPPTRESADVVPRGNEFGVVPNLGTTWPDWRVGGVKKIP